MNLSSFSEEPETILGISNCEDVENLLQRCWKGWRNKMENKVIQN